MQKFNDLIDTSENALNKMVDNTKKLDATHSPTPWPILGVSDLLSDADIITAKHQSGKRFAQAKEAQSGLFSTSTI